MQMADSRGVPVTTEHRSSLERYEQAVRLFAGYSGDPLAVIDQALAERPGFIMGHLTRAAILATTTEKAAEPLLRASVEAAEAHKVPGERARTGAHAGRACVAGRGLRALGGAATARLLILYPRDSLALQVAHLGDFFLGQSQMLRDRVARVLRDWDADVPGYGYVLGMHAFGLEETQHYERAEEEAAGRSRSARAIPGRSMRWPT